MFEYRRRSSKARKIAVAVFVTFGIGLLAFFFSSGYITTYPPALNNHDNLQQINNLQQDPAAGTGNNADAGTGNGSGYIAGQLNNPGDTTIPGAGNTVSNITTGETVAQAVARTATDSVVGITLEIPDSGSLFDRYSGSKVGIGSGFIVNSDGYILTNNHVAGVKNTKLIVTLNDGRNVEGVTVWSDPVLDLAIVKIGITVLPVVPLGDSDKLQVGEPAIAIGNPLGLEFQSTVTSGIISAVNRTIRIETEEGTNYMEDLIQTDASINPGNSGGPLLNAKGEVIGINTIKVSSAEGMGFAIPINAARPIIDRLAGNGSFKEAYLGIFAYDKQVNKYLNGLGSDKTHEGLYVAYIDETSPAYKAGIRKGCIIKAVDGVRLDTMLQLRTIIFSKNPGDTIFITHLKHGEDMWVTVPVTLAEKKDYDSIHR